jgi:hypothetical protein
MMRLKEISQKTKYKPEIFLDMDGVLADFFAEYAVMAGLPAGSSYRDIPPAKADPTLQKMVGTDFFYRLPKLQGADTVVAMAVKLFGSYNICSSPLRGDHENSGVQKTRWIQKHLNPQPRHIYIESRKEKHAVQPDGTPNILIDDRKDNIIRWENAGGIGIKYQADEDGLDVIARGLRHAVEVYKGLRQQQKQDLTPSIDRGAPVAVAAPKQEVNESSMHEHEERIRHFMAWCKDKLKLKQDLPEIEFSDKKDSEDMHHTGYYNDQENKLWVYTGNRNLIDILRTVAHEFTHRKQGEQGRIKGPNPPGSPLEQEADAMAGYFMKLYGKMYPEIIE